MRLDIIEKLDQEASKQFFNAEEALHIRNYSDWSFYMGKTVALREFASKLMHYEMELHLEKNNN